MANIRTGSIVSDIRGKVGTEIYSRNRGGAYVKAYAAPTNPNSSNQQVRRGFLAAAVAGWGNLSSQDRNAWEVFSQTMRRKGVFENIPIGGRAMYISSSINRLSIGGSGFSGAPVPPVEIPKWELAFVLNTGVKQPFNMVSNIVGNGSGFFYVLRLSRNLPDTIRSVNSVQFRSPGSGYSLSNFTSNIRATWEGLWSPPAITAGEFIYIWARVIHQNSGLEVGKELYRVTIG